MTQLSHCCEPSGDRRPSSLWKRACSHCSDSGASFSNSYSASSHSSANISGAWAATCGSSASPGASIERIGLLHGLQALEPLGPVDRARGKALLQVGEHV